MNDIYTHEYLRQLQKHLEHLPRIPDYYIICLDLEDIDYLWWVTPSPQDVMDWFNLNPGLEKGDVKIYGMKDNLPRIRIEPRSEYFFENPFRLSNPWRLTTGNGSWIK